MGTDKTTARSKVTEMKESEYQSDPILSQLSRLQEQMDSLVFGLPGYATGELGNGTLPPEVEVAICREFELSAVLLDVQMCDLTNRLLRDKDRVAKYPQLAAHLRAGQRGRKIAIRNYLIRAGIIDPILLSHSGASNGARQPEPPGTESTAWSSGCRAV